MALPKHDSIPPLCSGRRNYKNKYVLFWLPLRRYHTKPQHLTSSRRHVAGPGGGGGQVVLVRSHLPADHTGGGAEGDGKEGRYVDGGGFGWGIGPTQRGHLADCNAASAPNWQKTLKRCIMYRWTFIGRPVDLWFDRIYSGSQQTIIVSGLPYEVYMRCK